MDMWALDESRKTSLHLGCQLASEDEADIARYVGSSLIPSHERDMYGSQSLNNALQRAGTWCCGS